MSLEKKRCSSLVRIDAAYMNSVLAFMILSLVCGTARALNEKPSLSAFAQHVEQGDVITQMYKHAAELTGKIASLPPGKTMVKPGPQLKILWQKNQKNIENLESEFQRSATFIRGEIEQENTLNGMTQLLQLSLLQCRELSFESRWPEVQSHFEKWFLFAADFPYEESSLIGMRFTSVIRSILLDDLENIQLNFSSEIALNSPFRKWFSKVRSPWPVDRIFVSEAKRLLKPPLMPLANSAAHAFQKNPYQTSEQALKKVKGGNSEAARLLKMIWQENDILMMKTEINRIGRLRLRLAQAEYQTKNKVIPKSVQELVKSGLLDQAPIDYLSGKPMDLTSL